MTERHPTANACQRSRRARHPRIDYYPNAEALAVIEARRGEELTGSVDATNSAVVNAIVAEWAALTPRAKSGIRRQVRAHANESGCIQPELLQPSRTRPCAYDSGESPPSWAAHWIVQGKARDATRRVVCGARRRRDGLPCQAKSQPGKLRCKWHGGRSTGPRTDEGKARALANLRQYRKRERA